METLPWLVVYGNWIWRLSLLGLVTAALLYPWVRERLRRGARRNPDSSESSDNEEFASAMKIIRWGKSGPIKARLIPMIFAMIVFSAIFLFGGSLLDKASKKVSLPIGGATLEEILEMHRSSQFLAATPLGRRKALERLHYAIHYNGIPGPDVREALIALLELQGSCVDAMETMLRHRQFSRALKRSKECDVPRARLLAARAALSLGRLKVASDFLDNYEWNDSGYQYQRRKAIQVHLMAGEISRAADAAERTAEWFAKDSGWLQNDAKALAARAESGAQFSCLAHVLRARKGDSAAKAELDALLEGDATIECRVLAADLQQGGKRNKILTGVLKKLRAVSEKKESTRSSSLRFEKIEFLVHLLWAETDPAAEASRIISAFVRSAHWELSEYLPRRQMVGDDDILIVDGLGLEKGLFEALVNQENLSNEAKIARTILAFRTAVNASLTLRHDEALQLLKIAGKRGDPSGLAHIQVLKALIELRRGNLDAVRKILNTEFTTYQSNTIRDLRAMVDALERRELPENFHTRILSREALNRALKGDKELLADELRTPLNHIHLSLLFMLAPLAHWLPAEPLAHHTRYGRFADPFETTVWMGVNNLISFGRVAEAIGDKEFASNVVTTIYKLHDAALQREIALPLILLDSEGFR